MKYGYVILAILTCMTIVFATGWYKASADARIEARIIATHEKILELREQKIADCALMNDFPKSLLGICF